MVTKPKNEHLPAASSGVSLKGQVLSPVHPRNKLRGILRQNKYCYLDPDFPQEGYFAAIFFNSPNNPGWFLPVSVVSQNTDEIIASIMEIVKEIEANEGINAKIYDEAVFFPIKFQKLIPLKKEYWTKCKVDPKMPDKILAFAPVLMTPNIYNLLVVPYEYIEKEKIWQFAASYPFSVFGEDSDIEKFMYGSDQKVEIKANNAAVYSFGKGKRINWKTGEIKEFETQAPQRPKIVN